MTEPQHQAVFIAPIEPVRADRRPEPGPIAILPHPDQQFTDAVVAGGGTVAELSDETRGVIWLASKGDSALSGVLKEHPEIGWVQLPWAGVDSFASTLAEAADSGSRVLWTSAKGAYSQPVAEHALTLMLSLLRMIPRRVLATSWAKKREGTSLFGLNVVIVGAGGVGVELIRQLAPFGVHITVVRRGDTPVDGAERTVNSTRLAEMLPEADLVVIAAASTGATKQLIGAKEFALMKPTAYLVNIARGDLVDTDALTDALARGVIAGAGIDVTAPEPLPDGHPLWNEPNVIITPHSADTPEMTEPLLAVRVSQNVEAFLGDGRFVGIVDPREGY